MEMPMADDTPRPPANDNPPKLPAAGVTISLTDLAAGMVLDEDALLVRLAEILARRNPTDG
jgi:hypothetical protein